MAQHHTRRLRAGHGSCCIGFDNLRRRIKDQLIEFFTRPEARLIKPHSAIDQRVVYDDLFSEYLLAVFDDRQLRPPLLRAAVRIVFLAGTVATDGEWKDTVGAVAQFDLVARGAREQVQIAFEAV